jgi:solute carrier family 25 citrate transporter 1
MVGGAQAIFANKGIGGFYFGLPALMAQVSLKAGIRFFAFENIKFVMQQQEGMNSTMINLGAGLGAGMVEAMVWTAPTERLKVLRQNDINSATPKYRGLIGGMTTVVKEQGVGGLYAGVVPTAIRQASSVAVRFMLYAEFKKMLTEKDGTIQNWKQLIAGGATGIASTLLNNPIDVVKSRLQAQDKGATKLYSGTVDCLMKTAKQDGLTALYRGTVPRMLKVSAGQAITFFTYDKISELLYSTARVQGYDV